VLNLIDRRVVADIEIKGEGALKPVLSTIEEYIKSRGWSCGDFLVSSFNHLDLWRAKEIMPELRIGALVEVVTPGLVEFAKELKAYSLNVQQTARHKNLLTRLMKMS